MNKKFEVDNNNPLHCAFMKRVLFGPSFSEREKAIKNIYAEHWNAAANDDDFTARVLKDNRLKLEQGYAEISKICASHWYRVREMFGDKCFKTYSDAGSIRVCCAACPSSYTLISHGGGDGIARVAVFEDGSNFNHNMMEYTGILVTGNNFISDYDCGEPSNAQELNGRYLVYRFNGLMAFVKCGKC